MASWNEWTARYAQNALVQNDLKCFVSDLIAMYKCLTPPKLFYTLPSLSENGSKEAEYEYQNDRGISSDLAKS